MVSRNRVKKEAVENIPKIVLDESVVKTKDVLSGLFVVYSFPRSIILLDFFD